MSEPIYDREGTARMIRTYFLEHKKRLSRGGKYSRNDRHDHMENWLKAADSCLSLKANPRDFVDAAFALNRFSGGIFANMLVGPAARAWYHEYTHGRTPQQRERVERLIPEAERVERSPHDKAAEFTVMPVGNETILMADIKCELVLAHALMLRIKGTPNAWLASSVLNDEWLPIEPHIRVAIAGREKLTTIVKKFAAKAREYLAHRPGHVQCLEELGYNVTQYLNAAQH